MPSQLSTVCSPHIDAGWINSMCVKQQVIMDEYSGSNPEGPTYIANDVLLEHCAYITIRQRV